MLRFFDLAGVGGDHLIDRFFNRAGVCDLFHAARVNDLGRVAALGIDDLKQVLGDLAGDVAGFDQLDDAAQLFGGDG